MRRIAIVSLLILTSVANADDWPVYRRDNRRSGYTPERLEPASLSKAWEYRAPNPPHTAWPAPARWDAYAQLRGLVPMREIATFAASANFPSLASRRAASCTAPACR